MFLVFIIVPGTWLLEREAYVYARIAQPNSLSVGPTVQEMAGCSGIVICEIV